MDYGSTRPLFAIAKNIQERFVFLIFRVGEIAQEQNTDSGLPGLLFPVNHIHLLMTCQKVVEPVHEFFRSSGNLHYQSEKMRLKISSLRLRTISSSN